MPGFPVLYCFLEFPLSAIEGFFLLRSFVGRAYVQLPSHVQLFVTPRPEARQAPLTMGAPRQEHWSGWPFPSPGDLFNPGIKLSLLHWQADSLPLSHQGSPWKE